MHAYVDSDYCQWPREVQWNLIMECDIFVRLLKTYP